MPYLMDMAGNNCGHTDGPAPDGYWLLGDDAPTEMTPLQFLDKLGPERFASVWAVAVSDPPTAFPIMRGFAAQVIYLAESFPTLRALEDAGVLSQGTAIEVWSS